MTTLSQTSTLGTSAETSTRLRRLQRRMPLKGMSRSRRGQRDCHILRAATAHMVIEGLLSAISNDWGESCVFWSDRVRLRIVNAGSKSLTPTALWRNIIEAVETNTESKMQLESLPNCPTMVAYSGSQARTSHLRFWSYLWFTK